MAGLTQSSAADWAPQRGTSTSFKKFGDTQICRYERGIRFTYLVSSAVSFTACRQCGVVIKGRPPSPGRISCKVCKTHLGHRPLILNGISNDSVLNEMRAERLSTILHRRQLNYFGELARRPATCPVRSLIFDSNLVLSESYSNRRRGRPKLTWGTEVFKLACRLAGSVEELQALVADENVWRKAVRTYVSPTSDA